VGSPVDHTKILGLDGYRVEAVEELQPGPRGRLEVHIEQRGMRRYECSGCGRRCSRIRDEKVRTWDDLPWAERPVTLSYRLRRVRCRRCGIRTERVAFADPKGRITRRLRQQIGLDCQSMPTSHAAVRHGVSWNKARRAEKAFLQEWDASRPRRRPRHLGADEIHRGKKQKFYTVLSDLVHGEVIGLAKDRTEEALKTLLETKLDARQRAAVEAVCTDMHRPYVNAIRATLPLAVQISAVSGVHRHELPPHSPLLLPAVAHGLDRSHLSLGVYQSGSSPVGLSRRDAARGPRARDARRAASQRVDGPTDGRRKRRARRR
jgi:transposase